MRRPARSSSGRPAALLSAAMLAAFLAAGSPPFAAAPALGATYGLALSGGGSRGLAHVGALVGLEERGYDADVIAGTSMGAIVGALYAAGYDPDQITDIMTHEDWRLIFTPYSFEVGPVRSLRYPVVRVQTSETGAFVTRGYVPDWRINRKLVRLLFRASARARGDFDRLPRRFRSITAEAGTGALVPIGRGDLARAVRASMAVAGFFAPIRWDDRLLTDGGIADYLPVAEARRMGADSVVAVDILRPPPRLPSTDAIALARRSTEIMTVRARLNPVPPDILVWPALDPGLAPFDYPVDPTPVMEAGRIAVRASVPDRGAGTPPPRAPHPEPASLAALVVEDAPLAPFLRRSFRKAAPARRFDAHRILRVVDRLYATGLFDGVWPSVEGSADSAAAAPVLRIRAEPRGPVSVSGALGYDNDRGGRIWASLRRLGSIGSLPAEVALEGTADGVAQWGGAALRISSLALGGSAWTAGAHFGETEIRFFDLPDDASDVEVRRAGGWAGFESRWIEPSAFASAGVRADAIDPDLGPEGAAVGPWIQLGLVPPLVPIVGIPPAVEGDARFGSAGYWRARGRGSIDRAIGGLALAVVGDVAVVSDDAPLDVAPGLGDESLVPGLRVGERRGRVRVVTGIDAAHPIPFNATLRLRLRGGQVHDEVRADRFDPFGSKRISIGGVALSSLWWTPFGKVEVGLEGSTLGDRRVTVALGPDF